MAEIVEIPASLMVPEHRLRFKPADPAWEHVVVSGEVNLLKPSAENGVLQGHVDNSTSWYEVHLKVGPWWRDVQVCVPHVTINGFMNSDADEDNEQEWIIRSLKWTTDGEGAPNPGEIRIRLEFEVGLRGESSGSSGLATGSISLYGIFFDTDKTDIKPQSEPTLKEIAKLMTGSPEMSVIVVGHTDNQGAFDYNLDLSSRRAQAVKAELTSKYGIGPERLIAAGAGMMAPVASNDDEAGRAKNRRVVLVKAN